MGLYLNTGRSPSALSLSDIKSHLLKKHQTEKLKEENALTDVIIKRRQMRLLNEFVININSRERQREREVSSVTRLVSGSRHVLCVMTSKTSMMIRMLEAENKVGSRSHKTTRPI